MQIIVNHLTRMKPGYFCAAGINTANNQHVRPVLRERLTIDLLALHGGPFKLATLVDLGPVTYAGVAPEVEDYTFETQNTRCLGMLPPEQFWEHLQKVAHRNIREIFGPAIRTLRDACVVNVGAGNASLGCLIPAAPLPKLYIDNYGKIRMTLTDGTFHLDLSVTDIRLFAPDQKTPKENLIQQVNKRMHDREPVILSIGLTRPFCSQQDVIERHWLQVNNIHFAPPHALCR